MTVQDDGGTADGGQDTSIKTFTITITESQDPPSSTPGLDITVDDPPVAVDDNSDAGAENAGDSSTPIADDGAAVHLLSAPSSALGSVMAASTYPLIEQWDHDHAYSAQKTLAAGQNFRYREKLRLTKIALFLYTNDPTSARLVVQRGPFDSGTVVASATVDVDQCVKYYWYEFELEPQPVFAADEIFSILLYREGDADFKYAIALDSNPYEGTDLYHGQQTSLSNWDPWVDSDMAFKVWGEKLNEAPTVMNNGLTLLEGGTATITSAHLRADDADNPPASTLKFKVTASPRNGSLWRDGYYLSSNTFTQADLDGGLLVYKNSVTGQTSDSFKFTLTDGKVTLPEHTFDITIILVNEAPSFSLQKTSLWVQEDSGPQSYSDFAMNISAGQNESDQTVWFEVTADKPELFTDQPAIDANGTLTFTPAPDANGKARVTVQAFDNGGTAASIAPQKRASTFTSLLSTIPQSLSTISLKLSRKTRVKSKSGSTRRRTTSRARPPPSTRPTRGSMSQK